MCSIFSITGQNRPIGEDKHSFCFFFWTLEFVIGPTWMNYINLLFFEAYFAVFFKITIQHVPHTILILTRYMEILTHPRPNFNNI